MSKPSVLPRVRSVARPGRFTAESPAPVPRMRCRLAGPPVAVAPEGAVGTRLPFGVVDPLLVRTADDAVHHYHRPGAVLVGLKGNGYVNLWPKEFGIHPWQDGHANKVVQVQWGPNSIYSPPDGWFHQHMSTGKVPARHVACYGGTYPLSTTRSADGDSVMVPVREGGQLIDYEDEDPEVRRYFIEANAREGVECAMPPVKYRTDPFTPESLAKLGVRR